MNWNEGIKSELDFWGQWYATSGLNWQADYLFRLIPNSKIQKNLAVHLKTGKERILDVGSGPLTILGKTWKGRLLNISACDALAVEYALLNSKYSIKPPVVTELCRAENLSGKYKDFDIVHAQNSIDHSEDPLKAILEMVKVCKPGGKVILRHEVNEGKNENYQGLHQWDFYEYDGCFIISGKGKRFNMNLELKAKIETKVIEGYIENIIIKSGNNI